MFGNLLARTTLKSRAVAFALCAGGVAFFLSLLVTAHGTFAMGEFARALIPAIVCGTMCWAAAERSVSGTAAAIDLAIERLARAGEGDLDSATPPEVARAAPQLSGAMDALFAQLRASMDRIERLALFDTVTGLPNRAHFRRRCEDMLSALEVDAPAALLFIDLDRFKAVNDTKGHAVGDQLLRRVADRLRAIGERAGGAPLIGRLAGDEFTMFLDRVDGHRAAEVGRWTLEALAEPFELAGASIQIGASVGIALRPEHGRTLTELMRAADAAMYAAKAAGRGRAERFSDLLATRLADRAQLDQELSEAVGARQFALVFQPQLGSRDGRIVAAEALLRWRRPSGELRLPGSFIERAEETGAIVGIGDWVTDELAQTIARWSRAGAPQRLAVNVSRRQIDHAGFFRRLRRALHEAHAPARLLELEISETLAMQCGEEVLAAIAELREDGATLAIDGYGAGYTSLQRLRGLPVDRIKLDRSLTGEVADRADARMIAQSVIGLIHGLGCQAVAEGVETAAQADVLRVIGCDALQGYAVAEPMEESAFLAWAAGDSARAITSA